MTPLESRSSLCPRSKVNPTGLYENGKFYQYDNLVPKQANKYCSLP
jgi:hypothetical protein